MIFESNPACMPVGAFIHVPKTAGNSILQGLHEDKSYVLYHGHKTAYCLKRANESQWEQIFSFAFVRNPWDAALSYFFYHRKPTQRNFQGTINAFNGWVKTAYPLRRSFEDPKGNDQAGFILDPETLTPLVDFVGRFENLQEDFDKICRQIGMSETPQLRLINNTKHRVYQEYYNEESRRLVAESNKEIIEYFGYRFE